MGRCQRCNEARATVHITDTVPQKSERHLCEDCAAKEGIIIKQHHQTTNAILQQFLKHKSGLAAVEERACPSCGMTLREFQTKGLLGCPKDYEVFRNWLMPLIERAHGGGTQHVGRSPVTSEKTRHRQEGLRRLRRELQEAVDHENYEQAARVRDQIQSLESPESS